MSAAGSLPKLDTLGQRPAGAGMPELSEVISPWLAHDFQSWLTPVKTCLELYRAGGTDAVRAARLLPCALQNLAAIQATLDLARPPSPLPPVRRPLIRLGPLLPRAVSLAEALRMEKNVEIEVAVMGDETAEADETLILRLLTNLLHNAIQASPSGGRVRLELSRPPGEPDRVRLSVTNSAASVPPPDISPGQGLGLRICQAVAAWHGGELSLLTDEARCTVIARIEWPARVSQAVSESSGQPAQPPSNP